MSVRERKARGSSIVETAAGLILLIPIVLFLVDVAAMVVAQTENDKLAKAMARAAAEFPTTDSAGQTGAAQSVYNNQKRSNLLTPSAYTLTANSGMITCNTTITCTLPVPVPFIGNNSVAFKATATEPIVGELP